MLLDIETLPKRKRGSEIKRQTPTYEQKVEALDDYWKFIDLIGFQGGKNNFGQCHYDLIEWSDTHGSLKEIVLMPRGHLKSTLMTVGRTLHRIYQNPNIRIFVGTATKDLAAAFVREIKSYFEDPWLQEYVWNDRPHYSGRLIPIMERGGQRRSKAMTESEFEREIWDEETESEDKKVVWRGTALQVLRPHILKEPTVTVGAVGVQPTGFHFDELRLDDVVNYDNVMTPQKRVRLISWIDDLLSVLDDPYFDVDLEEVLPEGTNKQLAVIGGRITVCGTRYDREDWYGSVIDRINANTTKYVLYQKNIYKNGLNRDGGYLWHEKWDTVVEADKRAEITAQKFASQYLNEIVVLEEQILSPILIKRFIPPNLKQLESGVTELHYGDEKMVFFPIMVIDPAAAIGANSDYTAIVIGGKDRLGNLIVVDGRIGRWTSAQCVKNIYELADKWKLRRINVEIVGGFKHFASFIRSSFQQYRPLVIHEFHPTGKKEVRISNALEPLFANGMIYMSNHILVNQEIADQLIFFPRTTIHDDFPDALSALVELSKPPLTKPVRRLAGAINKEYGGYR